MVCASSSEPVGAEQFPGAQMRRSLVVLLVVMGCGSGSRVDGGAGGSAGTGGGAASAGGTASGGGSTGSAQFCTDFADAWCAQDERCGWLQAAQKSECLTRVAADCENRKTLNLAVREFSASAASECLAAVRGWNCREHRNVDTNGVLYSWAAECAAVFAQGKVARGGKCASSADCVSGFCYLASADCATCLDYVPAGGACLTSATGPLRCDPRAAFCNGGNDGGTCAPLVAVGQGPCTASAQCAGAASCTSGFSDGGMSDGGTRRCLEKLPVAAACTANSECASVWCSNNVCTAPVAIGASCVSGDPCADGGVCLDAQCRLRREDGPLHAECRSSLDCVTSAYCARDGGTIGTCEQRVVDGQPCNSNQNACQQGHICVPGSNLCAPVAGEGQPCTVHTGNTAALDWLQCGTFLMCSPDGGVCARWAGNGADCAPAQVICGEAGSTCGTTNQCAPLTPAGGACTTSRLCSSGRCRTADGGFAATGNPGTCTAACLP
jgi:hypothetical protein